MSINAASKLSISRLLRLATPLIDFTQQTAEQLSAHQFQHYADDDRNLASPTNVAVFQRYSPPSFYLSPIQSLPHSYDLLQQRDWPDTNIIHSFIRPERIPRPVPICIAILRYLCTNMSPSCARPLQPTTSLPQRPSLSLSRIQGSTIQGSVVHRLPSFKI